MPYPERDNILGKIPHDHLRLFCVQNGLYQLPTTELITWIKEKIYGRKTIEIGSGNGVFAEALGIVATDSFMQERPDIKRLYGAMGQAVVKYGNQVFKLDAKKAIKKYKPKVVIANWVTQIYKPDSDQGNVYGLDEQWLVKNVDCYIHIGNKRLHKKRILNLPHEEYQFSWLFSRASVPEDNVIYVWEK